MTSVALGRPARIVNSRTRPCRRRPTPLAAILRGVLAGTVGTAAMSAHQAIRQRLSQRHAGPEQENDSTVGGEDGDPWQSAPAPAQVGKVLIEGVGNRSVSPEAIPVLTQLMHWSYGSIWGAVFAIGRESLGTSIGLLGPLFGLGVWAVSYLELVPLGIYEPPWTYKLSAIGEEIGYHLIYGTTVAVAYHVSARLADAGIHRSLAG